MSKSALSAISIICGAATITLCVAGCGGSKHHDTSDKPSTKPASSSSSPVSTGSADTEATSASSTASVPTSPQTKHLLQAADLPSGIRIQQLAPTAIQQAAEQVEGAASPVPATTTKPACTKAVNSGKAAHPVNPNQLAGEALILPGAVLTEIIVPKSIASQGLQIGQQQQHACAGATLTETVNGVKVSVRPTFSTGPHNALIETSTLTSPGKKPLYATQAIELAGQTGIAFSSQSTAPIQAATINRYLSLAATRAAH